MKSCSFFKQVIKPYKLSSSGQISSGAFYFPNDSNFGYVATGRKTFSNHMGCSKIVNKKFWPWIILGFAFIIAFCLLFVFGMINFLVQNHTIEIVMGVLLLLIKLEKPRV
ncbi:hypothetical protein [Mesoplasma melaleucae]|uniref:Uncharacterized protein n=1 Tax=Mesoplasma melaleucae TaxID=81459 RepID=A0A2K8NXJ4_9MOLU|nr:hypothetical protein [Mesoplasma melaleucae]ATZ18266.1 hypothetical protein EMELA_v1c07790 [Mesoplasma melaleucae]